ncbi:CAP domain-containing protein [Streptomyces sp. SCA3-4]|uniref:CAP domain-containing protein n=1 Tax=Streptomyces sichuanensis TaxID=2871810 RepID=UPI001CE2EDFC|nr:CAP domain-containing protein [Streptomyces sichuanensis]MCA6095856.1 CAP domain-containing protein [Streptomyces sichuanensis]
MNRESETSTFDLTPEGGRRSRRRRGRRPRRAVVLSGAVAVMAVVGGGYGVAQSMGGGGGDTGAAAEVSTARAADRAPGLPGVPPSEGAAAPSAAASAAPSASPRSASPTASATATATEAGKGSGAQRSAGAGSDSGKGAGGGSGAKGGEKSGNDSTSASTTTNRQAPAAGAPAGGKNGSHVQQVVDMVNAERARAGCSPVTVNAKLQAAAQGHSDDMAARDYYAHTSPEGKSPGDRMTAAGYRWSTYGENIFKSPKDARTAMDGWMKSSGHRANILNCAFKEIGVGINFSANGPWWTQNFGASS